MKDIMRNIRRLRQSRGLTQEELAERLHVTRQAVSNWETGKNQPDIELLQSLAECLEVEVTELLYGPKPNEDHKKKAIMAAILMFLSAAAWVGYISLAKWASWMAGHAYIQTGRILASLVAAPLTYMLTGAAAAALLAVWLNVPPTRERIRRRMLNGVAAFCLLYIVILSWVLLGVFASLPIPEGLSGLFWTWRSGCQWIFFFSGTICFFCGIRKVD